MTETNSSSFPFLLNLSELSWPTDWETIYSNSGPLHIEIGFGSGRYLVELAKKYPRANILGLEIYRPALRKVERRLDSQETVKNLRLIHGKAESLLWTLCKPNSVAALYINFPDPWPRPGHHHRRLIGKPFLDLAASRMVYGASIKIATDHDEYASWIAECFARSDYFDSEFFDPYVTQLEDRIPTKYELKAVEAGIECYYFSWRRNSAPVDNYYPVPEVLEVPHAIITLPVDIEDIGRSLRMNAWTIQGITIRMAESFISLQKKRLLIDTYIKEEYIEQRLLIALGRRESGDYRLYLHDAGHPRPTNGVHAAIAGILEQLLDLYPDVQVKHHNLRQSMAPPGKHPI